MRHGLAALAAVASIGAVAAQPAGAETPVESATGTTLPSDAYNYDRGTFYASSCAASGACVSVGDYKDDAGTDQGLILASQDGLPASGGAIESSVTIDNTASSLGSVSCWSSTSCVAVGAYEDTSVNQQALVVPIINGVPGPAQEIQPPQAPSPNPVDVADPGASLRGVSCEPSGVCVAVGIYHDTSGGYDGFEVTIDNGSVGSPVEIPAPSNTATTQEDYLFDVSCQAGGSCVAVGQYSHDNSGDTYALVVPIDNGVPGEAAAETSVPGDSDPAQDGWLSDVSCPAAGICSAIGGYLEAGYDRTMVIPITAGTPGQATEVLPPADATDTEITDPRGMSCQPSGNCVVVGDYEIAGSSAAVAIPIDNGVPSAAVEIPLPTDASSAPDARLDGVACPASGPCIAGGDYEDTGSTSHAITVSFDNGILGAATVAPVPGDLSSSQPFSTLTSVGCASTSCLVTGNYNRATDGNDNPYVLGVQTPLTIAPTSLPAGAVGAAYSHTLSVSGAWGVYGSWSVASGTLPAGVSLNAQTGVISGTPTAAGTSTFTVQISATSGTPLQTASQSYSLTIAAQASPPSPPVPTPAAASPKLTLLSHSATVTKNKFSLKLSCSAAACHGSLKLRISETVTVKHGKKKVRKHEMVTIGNAGFSLLAGQTKSIKVTINAVGRRALAARHRLSVTVLDTLGGVKGTLGHVTLKPAPVKHKKKH